MTRSPLALDLEPLQAWLLATMTHPSSVSAALEEHAARVPPARLTEVVRGSPHASALERLEIYRGSYFARLEECLADDYPAVRHALGADAFGELCRQYVTEHPSRSSNLNGLGAQLPDYLREVARGAPAFVPELARLEWALVEAIHAHAPPAITGEALASAVGARLADVRFVANPAMRLLHFEHAVDGYLQAFFDGHEPHDPEARAQHIVVLRQGFRLARFELAGAAALILGRLLAGERLADAFAGATCDPATVQRWFSEWTAHGVFSGLIAPRFETANGIR